MDLQKKGFSEYNKWIKTSDYEIWKRDNPKAKPWLMGAHLNAMEAPSYIIPLIRQHPYNLTIEELATLISYNEWKSQGKWKYNPNFIKPSK